MTLQAVILQVRLQLQNIANTHAGMHMHKYRGSVGTIKTIIREEGAAAPFKALSLPTANPSHLQYTANCLTC